MIFKAIPVLFIAWALIGWFVYSNYIKPKVDLIKNPPENEIKRNALFAFAGPVIILMAALNWVLSWKDE